MTVIEVKNLSKSFGKVRAVEDLNFSVEKGEIFGFLGPNGAGKTTTIRCIMDFVKPTSGEIKLLDRNANINSHCLKNKIGYLPGNVKLYESWSGSDHFSLLEAISGKSNNLSMLVEKLDFNPGMKAYQLSSGNRQKLGLIMALMHEPEILIMDEPTVGLDPLLQNTIYDILEDLRSKGTSIFMSSHNLPEVERLCNRVGIIKDGKMIAQESIDNLRSKRIHRITINFNDKFAIQDFVFDSVEVVETFPDRIVLSTKGDINPLIKKLSNYEIQDISIEHASLEEVFLEFYAKDKTQKEDKCGQ
ncbi:TPA: ABC transporter ATP-binding protein [Candidatus Berkelbacteria bacterium]|uniref:ABC transporter-like protein, antibiotic transport system ATP-binding protein n=1 Tax=Berkelbacteria bacterium GW2011_GWE1_39_12 TaxID=1618337 RepID=A0A0G4B4H1_9BACT|nr:MAG: ABC transporter-like protein, antibiotic transport system ATP-binding protein [Berkelbacteria bacterium GW2011_GWE1_39_12]HBO60395.1 ABC transporter ATP-binding protein [Candidatus Berkelbacteria bacterium]